MKISNEITNEEFAEKLSKELEKNEKNIEAIWDNDDNYYKITFIQTGHIYSMNSDGKIDFIVSDDIVLKKSVTVTFNANGGDNLSESTRKVTEGTRIGVLPTVSQINREFDGWYTEEGEMITENSIVGTSDVTYYAHWIINVNQSLSLRQATEEVETNGIQTVIKLEKNETDHITIKENQNILLNLQNNTLNNTVDNTNAIKNYGTIEITNGTVQSNNNYAAIDNESTGKMKICGSTVLGFTAQGICNNGGDLYIDENAEITANSSSAIENRYRNERGANTYIRNGTVTSANFQAITNPVNCTLIIGTKDNAVNINSPIIRGANSAIRGEGEIYFYDGIIKGTTTKNLSNILNIVDKETGYLLEDSIETINNKEYKTLYLVEEKDTINFDPNGGVTAVDKKNIQIGQPIGTLPIPERANYNFIGWFTSADGGIQITEDTIMECANNTYYAHWSEILFAEVNGIEYKTLQEAVSAVTGSEQTTVKLMRNTSEKITVNSDQNIIFDLQNYTISNNGTNQVIDNYGTITIQNGTISSSANTGVINNNSGATLVMTGGSVLATGTRQAIWNNGGTVKISGTAYLSASAQVQKDNKRGTVHNLNSGNLEITGGTIVALGNNGIAVSNNGIMSIGTLGEGVSTETPEIKSNGYGVYSIESFNFYDGIIKGISAAFNDESLITKEIGYEYIRTTEVISDYTYNVVYLGEI